MNFNFELKGARIIKARYLRRMVIFLNVNLTKAGPKCLFIKTNCRKRGLLTFSVPVF